MVLGWPESWRERYLMLVEARRGVSGRALLAAAIAGQSAGRR